MKSVKIALLGNPNSGKSTIFNNLTGLKQKISNFPGVTVEQKIGDYTWNDLHYLVTDLPGTYSLFPNSMDEKLVCEILINADHKQYPELIVFVADTNNLERHLLLLTQIIDLKIPVVLVLNMMDIFYEDGNEIHTGILEEKFQIPVILSNARENDSTQQLKALIHSCITSGGTAKKEKEETFYKYSNEEYLPAVDVMNELGVNNLYVAKLLLHHFQWLSFLPAEKINQLQDISKKYNFENIKIQIKETMTRFSLIQPVVNKALIKKSSNASNATMSYDEIVTHKLLGPIIFFGLMFLIFQSIFRLAEYPMTWIEDGFSYAGESVRNILPEAWYTDLLVDGILAGLSGVLVFIPQIALLFYFLALLEESGYMSRVVYMFDHIMQKFGLNGRSMVALISSGACAIPAIMSTRTIGNWKERLITMLVAPIIPCSARIPVYTVLIALIIPTGASWGMFNLQGLAFMALYLLGIVASLLVAFVLKKILKTEESSFLLMELPLYKKPLWSNVFYEVKDKVWSFIFNAGKIIFIISILLWYMASYGPNNNIENAEKSALQYVESIQMNPEQIEPYIQSKKLEASYAGITGKAIEPVIAPLGFDWKIGISLLTSFAAREVFVGTMATIYSVGSDAEEISVRERMAQELRPGTLKKLYDLPTSLSLLVFYAFAMQCMSTLAVMRKETFGWKWPIIQLVFLTTLAYLSSLLVYHLFS